MQTGAKKRRGTAQSCRCLGGRARLVSAATARMSFRSQMGRHMTGKPETSGDMFDYDGVFGEHYLHFYGPDLTAERNAREAEVIRRLLSLQSGEAVLDLARKDATAADLPVTFVEGDMRDLPWRETLDDAVLEG